MDPKFIELHDIRKNNPTSVNIAHIINFRVHEKDGVTVFETSDRNNYAVSETYDEIKQLIKESGILIHKADPRLDTSHPLTYDEMREMPGQPIWHSNTDQWAIIAYVGDEHIRFEGVNLYAPESRVYMGDANGWRAYRKEKE